MRIDDDLRHPRAGAHWLGLGAVMRIEAGQVRLSASDVANFLACWHLTRLELLRARGVISPPRAYDAGFADLVARADAANARRVRIWHPYS
jgi:hypothetical protein